jgi:argonaute-like protein implicated in RNA metabolism and viral defense
MGFRFRNIEEKGPIEGKLHRFFCFIRRDKITINLGREQINTTKLKNIQGVSKMRGLILIRSRAC